VYRGNDWLISKAEAPHVAREAWTEMPTLLLTWSAAKHKSVRFRSSVEAAS
jgi:hypothetical protein